MDLQALYIVSLNYKIACEKAPCIYKALFLRQISHLKMNIGATSYWISDSSIALFLSHFTI